MTITSNELIIVTRKLEEIRIGFNDVLYLQSDGNYTHLYTERGKFTEYVTIKQILSKLTDQHPFTRIHRSYVVNKNKVRDFTFKEVYIKSNTLPVGAKFIKHLNEFFYQAG
jgi:DNA-binding LytR/AlgR family response regulator